MCRMIVMIIQVTVMIICLLFNFSSKDIPFLNVITWEHLMFLLLRSVTSSTLF